VGATSRNEHHHHDPRVLEVRTKAKGLASAIAAEELIRQGAWVIFCVYFTDCLKIIHLQIPPAIVPAEDPRVHIPS
jgi:hypothetical protein